MSTWKEDRLKLRAWARDTKPSGEAATAVYTLISHMREKIHMRYYGKYNIWVNGYYKTSSVPPAACKKLQGAYGDYTEEYHKRVYIGSLEDQERWLKEVGLKFLPLELVEVGKSVMEGYPEEEEAMQVAV